MRFRAVALAFALCAVALTPAGAAQRPPLVETQAPGISLPLIANGSGRFVLARQRGHGVYINFFASWCKPCDQEARTIEAVTSASGSRDIRILGIALLDTPSAAQKFVRSHALRYPIAFDESGAVGAAYRLTKLPLHVFIGPDGVVKQYVEGGPIPKAELQAGLASIAR